MSIENLVRQLVEFYDFLKEDTDPKIYGHTLVWSKNCITLMYNQQKNKAYFFIYPQKNRLDVSICVDYEDKPLRICYTLLLRNTQKYKNLLKGSQTEVGKLIYSDIRQRMVQPEYKNEKGDLSFLTITTVNNITEAENLIREHIDLALTVQRSHS